MLAIHTQSKPRSGLNKITKRELLVLFTTFGSIVIPTREYVKFFSANKLSEPPLCSKNAQNTIENRIKIKAAISFFCVATSPCLAVS